MPPKKKAGFVGHAKRVGNRIGDRAKTFTNDARSGTYDHVRLAQDVGGMVMDVVDFWGGLFGAGASPTVGVVKLSAPAATYKLPAGVMGTVLVEDPVPGDAVWPVNGGALAALRLTPVQNPGAPVDLELLTVDNLDDEGLDLRITVRTFGGPPVAAGEYYGNLYYESASLGAGQYFAAVIRATVT